MKTDISIIIPVLNEERNIPILYKQLKEVLDKLKKSYEIIFIDDGSRDKTYQILQKLHKKDKKHIKVIKFRKNFGKAAALSAGFSHAQGNAVITMDGDLQDEPTEIPNFLEALKTRDLIVGWKYRRKDPAMKKLSSKIFNKLTAWLTGLKIHDFNCCFKAYKKEVVKSLHIYGELHRYIPALVNWKGYEVQEIKIKHNKRLYGKSKYGMMRLFRGFMDLWTIKFLIGYKNKPLHLFGSLGIVSTLFGGLLGLYLLGLKYFFNESLGNRPLVFLSMLLVITGLQLFSMGLIAEMITSNSQSTKTYEIGKVLN